MCGGHHVAAGGGKLLALGSRNLGLEAGDVLGDVVNLLVRFRVMDTGKALLSTQDRSRCGWQTIFPADCGGAYFVRKALGSRVTLVRKRGAWYQRVKLIYYSARNKFERFRGFLELISRFEFEFCRCENFFLKDSNFWCVHVNVPWSVCAHAILFRMLWLP